MTLDPNVLALRAAPVADAVRAHRLSAVLRRVAPRDPLVGIGSALVRAAPAERLHIVAAVAAVAR